MALAPGGAGISEQGEGQQSRLEIVVEECLLADVAQAGADRLALAQLFVESGFRRYPVMRDNRLIGQISRRDVLRALQAIAAPEN